MKFENPLVALLALLCCSTSTFAQPLDPSRSDTTSHQQECAELMSKNIGIAYCAVRCKDAHSLDPALGSACRDSKGNIIGKCCPPKETVACLPDGSFRGKVPEACNSFGDDASGRVLYVAVNTGANCKPECD